MLSGKALSEKIPAFLTACRKNEIERKGLRLKKAIHWLDENFECTVCMVLLCVFTVILFIQVVMRYVFNNSLSWSEECARYLFIWLVFIGISYGAKQMKHLKIDVFLNVFPKKIRPYIIIFADVVVLVFGVVVVYSAFTIVTQYMKIGTASPAVHVPYWVIHSSALVGYGMTVIRQIQTIIYRVKELKAGDLGAIKSDEDEEVML